MNVAMTANPRLAKRVTLARAQADYQDRKIRGRGPTFVRTRPLRRAKSICRAGRRSCKRDGQYSPKTLSPSSSSKQGR